MSPRERPLCIQSTQEGREGMRERRRVGGSKMTEKRRDMNISKTKSLRE